MAKHHEDLIAFLQKKSSDHDRYSIGIIKVTFQLI